MLHYRSCGPSVPLFHGRDEFQKSAFPSKLIYPYWNFFLKHTHICSLCDPQHGSSNCILMAVIKVTAGLQRQHTPDGPRYAARHAETWCRHTGARSLRWWQHLIMGRSVRYFLHEQAHMHRPQLRPAQAHMRLDHRFEMCHSSDVRQ